jgi:hypothetical protein
MHDQAQTGLTLTFAAQGAGARVRWEAAVLGVRHSQFHAPYRGADLPLVLRALDMLQAPSAAFTTAEGARLKQLGLPISDGMIEPHAAQVVGRALYAALTADPEGMTALRTVRDAAVATGARLTFQLHFAPDTMELAALPWELLWGDEPTPLLVSRGQLASCTRHLDLAEAVPPAHRTALPLRIQPVIAQAGIEPAWAAADRAARLQAWQPLIATDQVVMLHEVSPATRSALFDALQAGTPPDIVHLVCHGKYEEQMGYLVLDTPDGNWDIAPISQLVPLFHGVRMVVISACQSAMMGAQPADPLRSSIALALSTAGVPIVVAMQLTIRVEAANRAIAILYQQLAQRANVQTALARARQALYVEATDGASWYVPTLSIRARDEGPVYLIAPPTQSVPQPRPAGVRQTITATGKGSTVTRVTQQGSGSVEQTTRAESGGVIQDAAQRGTAGAQELHASDDGQITNVEQTDDT